MVTWSSGDDEDILEDDEPNLDTVMIQHTGAVNRIRVRSKSKEGLLNLLAGVLLQSVARLIIAF